MRRIVFVSAPTLICISLAIQAGTGKVASVFTETLPVLPVSQAPAVPGRRTTVAVQGILFGRPFVAEEALINSYSLILRQKHKIYARVVLNFSAFKKVPAGQEFFSRGRLQPRIEVYQRLENGAKVSSMICSPATYALHLKFAERRKAAGSDTTPGAIILRFDNGDYVAGAFVARQSPRIVWDDETIEK